MEEDHTYEVRGKVDPHTPGGSEARGGQSQAPSVCGQGSVQGLSSVSCLQGLDIDQTATYEDIVTLRTGEVKWSVGEHPGQE